MEKRGRIGWNRPCKFSSYFCKHKAIIRLSALRTVPSQMPALYDINVFLLLFPWTSCQLWQQTAEHCFEVAVSYTPVLPQQLELAPLSNHSNSHSKKSQDVCVDPVKQQLIWHDCPWGQWLAQLWIPAIRPLTAQAAEELHGIQASPKGCSPGVPLAVYTFFLGSRDCSWTPNKESFADFPVLVGLAAIKNLLRRSLISPLWSLYICYALTGHKPMGLHWQRRAKTLVTPSRKQFFNIKTRQLAKWNYTLNQIKNLHFARCRQIHVTTASTLFLPHHVLLLFLCSCSPFCPHAGCCTTAPGPLECPLEVAVTSQVRLNHQQELLKSSLLPTRVYGTATAQEQLWKGA